MAIHILGIRHHGVGSAKRVEEQLQSLKPDMILIEGPPEITEMLGWVGNKDLKPPVSLMIYNIANPKQSVFYPFADYSPEWVAARYANEHKIPLRSLDLPAAVSFALTEQEEAKAAENQPENISVEDLPDDATEANEVTPEKKVYVDPMTYFAELDGFETGEAWWDYHFERRIKEEDDHFQGVMLAMETLREAHPDETGRLEQNLRREAYMRTILREARNEMYENIVVVCGAWHAPVLNDLDGTNKEDVKTLKSLPKKTPKIATTWIPWTNGRLSMYSGYGAGIQSPGWYEHNWHCEEEIEINWLTKVAKTFREKGIDISTAHIIEAYNLSYNLAALRNKTTISLEELNEAILSVMCMGEDIMLELIREKLIVGNKLGEVPEDIPKVPLQEDFEQTLKSLRLKLSPYPKEYVLDLRKEPDLKKSIFFHRLQILEITWMQETMARSKGTFKEAWTAEWQPEMMVTLIDKAYMGNTVDDAANAIVLQRCNKTDKISELAELIHQCLPAELFDSIDKLLVRINDLSAVSADINDLMGALPQLIDVSRYGNVRKSDVEVLTSIVDQLLIKVFVGLPNGCYGLDEENSNRMFGHISQMNHSIRIYENEDMLEQWQATLRKIIDRQGIHAIIQGCVCRLLLDADQLSDEEASSRISRALSVGNDPHVVASWLEGFLRGNAMILIYDNYIWNLLYTWVSSIDKTIFMELLPLLRRAFSKFEFAERRQIGEKAKKGLSETGQQQSAEDEETLDAERAARILPVLQQLMGIENKTN